MRMRKKKNLVPRMERCAAQLIRDPYEHRGHWRDLMPQVLEVSGYEADDVIGTAAARAASPTAPPRRSRMCCSSPLRWCRTPWW